eukprot:1500763-Amphidinium_carterae.1
MHLHARKRLRRNVRRAALGSRRSACYVCAWFVRLVAQKQPATRLVSEGLSGPRHRQSEIPKM